MAQVPITVWHDEDLVVDFTLLQKKAEFAHIKRPTIDQCEPRDITDATFDCEAKFGSRVLPITVEVIDEGEAHIQFRAPMASLIPLKNKTGEYKLRMLKDDIWRVLFTGPFAVLGGV